MEFNIQLGEPDHEIINSAIRTIKSCIIDNEELKAKIKENNDEIKNETSSVLVKFFGKEGSKVILDLLKDELLKEKVETQLDTIKFLEKFTHVK